MRIFIAALLFLCLPASAATYYIRTDGSDSNTGLANSAGGAWLTIQKAANTVVAGDTVEIQAGTYLEDVTETTDGSSGSPITYHGNGTVILRDFRVNGAEWITLSGLTFKFTGHSIWQGMIRVESTSHNLVVTNCAFGPQPLVFGTNFVFFSSENTISNSLFNFTTEGFVTNQYVWIAGYTETNAPDVLLWPCTNGFKSWLITNVGTTTMQLSGNTMISDSPKWLAMYPGNDKEGVHAIEAIAASSAGSSNATVINCTFDDLWGAVVTMNANHTWTFRGNTFTASGAFKSLIPSGTNILFELNTFKDSTNFLYSSGAEIGKFTHSTTAYPSPDAIDWIFGQIHTGGGGALVDLTFRSNCWYSIHNDFTQFSSGADRTNLLFDRNIIVGVAGAANGAQSGYRWRSNTFLKVGFNTGELTAVYAQSTAGVEFVGNVFVDIGGHSSTNNLPYSTTSSTELVITNNFVAQTETSGWHGYSGFNATNGVNGGDPCFVDIWNPLGADGLPFTDDDGLRPLASSPFVGLGALGVRAASGNDPLPHFTLLVTTPQWFDAVGEAWDANWVAADFWTRTNFVRPWETPEAIGEVPCTVVFDASSSVSGTWSTNSWKGIKDFVWDFGDGSTIASYWPTQQHTFLVPGTYAVKLTTINSMTNTATITNYYRVLPLSAFANDIFYVSTNGNDTTGDGSYATPWRTIEKSIQNAQAGDYVAVLPGVYDEEPRINNFSGTAGNPITFVGYGAEDLSIRIDANYITVDGFDLTGGSYTGAIYVYQTADNAMIRNCHIHDTVSPTRGVYVATSGDSSSPLSGSLNCSVIGCTFTNVNYVQIEVQNGSNWLCSANRMMWSGSEGDAFRLLGSNHKARKNYIYDMNNQGTGGHTDVLQLPQSGAATSPLFKDIEFSGNWVEGSPTDENSMALGQFESQRYADSGYSNLMVFNNVFLNVPGQFSDSNDGGKWWNNLFVNCGWRSAPFLNTGGGASGSSYGWQWTNNLIVTATTSASSGWYNNFLAAGVSSNSTFTADYNLTTGSDFSAKDAAPPDDGTHWGITGTEANGINGGDPVFLGASDRNYMLATNSPAYASGVDLSALFTTDFWGETRSIWSMGPFEFSADAAESEPPAGGGSGNRTVYSGTLRITGRITTQ
jgi:hypothetical protein